MRNELLVFCQRPIKKIIAANVVSNNIIDKVIACKLLQIFIFLMIDRRFLFLSVKNTIFAPAKYFNEMVCKVLKIISGH